MLPEGSPHIPGWRISSGDSQILKNKIVYYLIHSSQCLRVMMCCAIWAVMGLKAKAVIRKVCQLANSVWGARVTQNAWGWCNVYIFIFLLYRLLSQSQNHDELTQNTT